MAVVVALTSCTSPAPRGQADQPIVRPATPVGPAHHSTGDRSELVGALPVLPRAVPAGRRVVYSQPVTLAAGDVLLASAEFQVTNDLGRNVYVGSTLLVTTGPSATTGREVTAANGENVTPAIHHGQQTKSGTYRARDTDAGARHVNLVAWAAASGAAPGDQLRVDRGYGRLSVLQW